MLRAAVFLSITGVIQHSQQTFLFCHDGYTDRDIWMSQVLHLRKLKILLFKLSVCLVRRSSLQYITRKLKNLYVKVVKSVGKILSLLIVIIR